MAFPIAQVIPPAQPGWNWASPAREESISALSLPPRISALSLPPSQDPVCSSTEILGTAAGVPVFSHLESQNYGMVWVRRVLKALLLPPPTTLPKSPPDSLPGSRLRRSLTHQALRASQNTKDEIPLARVAHPGVNSRALGGLLARSC